MKLLTHAIRDLWRVEGAYVLEVQFAVSRLYLLTLLRVSLLHFFQPPCSPAKFATLNFFTSCHMALLFPKHCQAKINGTVEQPHMEVVEMYHRMLQVEQKPRMCRMCRYSRYTHNFRLVFL